MKILLLGEYSGLHLTLAEALTDMGHSVTVASDGDGFKKYKRDIDLFRKSSSVWDTFSSLKNIVKHLSDFKGYDVVQIINPCFTTQNIRINIELYRFLKRHNNKVFLGAFGDDYFWLKACLNYKFRYSEFNVEDKPIINNYNRKVKEEWSAASRKNANIEMAETSDGIISCLYEYYQSYEEEYSNKLTYIPLPVNIQKITPKELSVGDKINFFIGINKARNEFKGTDLLYETLLTLQQAYPNDVNVIKAESIPYDEYQKLIADADVVLDQIYSSPAMNGLLTMTLGKILVSGGGDDMYKIKGEDQNMPIVCVKPLQEDIYQKLEYLVLNRDQLNDMGKNSRSFVEKYHDHFLVAQQYLNFWNKE